jgi:hypothetical protein
MVGVLPAAHNDLMPPEEIDAYFAAGRQGRPLISRRRAGR